MPSFAAKDIKGNNVSDAMLRGKVAVVFTWANWNYESCTMRSKLSSLKRDYGDRLALMGINLDPSVTNCKNAIRNDSTSTITICDQAMFDSPLLEQFGFNGVPGNILFNAQGHVLERDLKPEDLESRIKVLLN